MYQKMLSRKKHVDLLSTEEEEKRHLVFIKNLMIIPYNVEENIFAVIVYKLLAQKKY